MKTLKTNKTLEPNGMVTGLHKYLDENYSANLAQILNLMWAEGK